MKTRLAGDLQAPSAARAFVESHLGPAVGDHGLVEDAMLVVSELVTNAVRAGATGLDVALKVTPRRVVLTVDDDADGWPIMVTVGSDAVQGRGLSIVDQLADEWQVSTRAGRKRMTAAWNRKRPRA
jgi:anti-sigma regulatory factor (Ser/Thr protein kinase)